MRFRRPFVAIATVAMSACWGSPPRPQAPARTTQVALDIAQLELPNGLRLVVVTEPAAAEASVTVRYGVGAADDPPGKEGMAHLVEHLTYEEVRGSEALFDYLEAHTLGFNGFTTADATMYTARATPGQIADLLEVEAARVEQDCNAIPAASFTRQLQIVRNELRERSDRDRVLAALDDGLFSSAHPLAGRIATPASVATITQAEACAFAAAHYAPANAVVVLSGPLSAADARSVVQRSLGRIARPASAHTPLPPAPPRRRVTIDAPIDRPWVVLAWPLPEDVAARARMRAVVGMAQTLVNARVNGLVTTLELGAGSASQIAIAVAASGDISLSDALDTTRYVITHTNNWFGSGLYEHEQYRAAYRFAADLDGRLDRDLVLAQDVAAGHEARTTLDAALHAVMGMTRDDAHALISRALDPDAATIVTLRPSRVTASGGAALTQPFREARRRASDDPAGAHRPAGDTPSPTNPLAQTRERRLANGLRVVLLPLSTMPTVDIRLVFPAGSGDEPRGKRGIALLAAAALSARDDADTLRFIEAGGRVATDVGVDHTTFIVRGLASQVDQLLSGLSATVRDGSYDRDSVTEVVEWEKLAARRDTSDAIATLAWRSALYGNTHPYVEAGLWRHVDRAASDPDALAGFDAANYRPSEATLVVAGRFDPVSVDRWVDYYFASWSGTAAPRGNWQATLQPYAFAQPQDIAQVDLELAFPAPGADRIAWRIATEMVEEALADAREQLAATYGLHAQLVDTRLSSTIVVHGRVDASRAAEVVMLLRDRLMHLREASDETSSLFVSARRRVIAQLESVDVSANALAELFVHDAALGLTTESEVHASASAAKLTIESLTPLLQQLDLSHAAMLVRGPEQAVGATYAAIGRAPAPLR